MRRQRAFTLVETIIAMGVVLILGAIAYASYAGIEAQSRDKAGVSIADGVAQNLGHYAALNGGLYPTGRTSASWATIMGDLGTLAEYSATAPTTFTGSGGFLVYDTAGNTFQIEFWASGGSGAVYCRTPNGLAQITKQNSDGPWTGCP
ncbi:MAG TPA: prepilin-type N-terminal cleavage/methylation domain-containing protein [bacterium]|nr:prepilin-type N-terminal cleavage/methylation domain-containing protein [bacterium]